MLCGEGEEGLENMSLDGGTLCLWVVGVVRNDRRCEVCIVDGIVNGDCNLETSLIVDYSTGDTCPHWLVIGDNKDQKRLDGRL